MFLSFLIKKKRIAESQMRKDHKKFHFQKKQPRMLVRPFCEKDKILDVVYLSMIHVRQNSTIENKMEI